MRPTKNMRCLILVFLCLMLVGAGCKVTKYESSVQSPTPSQSGGEIEGVSTPAQGGDQGVVNAKSAHVNFSQFNPVFRFSAEVPSAWKIEYVPVLEAINIYNPAKTAESAREQSQIFIRYFKANDFLTLRTVDILEREETELHGHSAVRYEISKKQSAADFANQPAWRNARHTVVDVRMAKINPGIFYVFAYNPTLPSQEFTDFLQSVKFHNDAASFISPLDRPTERISKKPFGLYVTPENSPVQPERFSGYHNAVDFEVFSAKGGSAFGGEDEIDKDVGVRAFCGGKVRVRRVADGYGGLLVQDCLIGDEPATVIYGHLNIDSVSVAVGEYLAPGDKIGLLGKGETPQTDRERKHLHFGIHKGTNIDLRGYVTRKDELDLWLDPWQYISTK